MKIVNGKWNLLHPPKCELPKLIIRQNIGPISAANSRLLLLGQCRCLQRSSAGPVTVTFVDRLNLPTVRRNLAQYRPYTKPIVTFTMSSGCENERAKVRPMDDTLLGHVLLLPRQTIPCGKMSWHSIVWSGPGLSMFRSASLEVLVWLRSGAGQHSIT